MKQIQIQISGEAGTDRGTIALLVFQALTEAGINADIAEADEDEVGAFEDPAESARALRDEVHIQISLVTTQRENGS